MDQIPLRARAEADTSQRNETLCKFVAQNVCCLIHAMYELAVTPPAGSAYVPFTVQVVPFTRAELREYTEALKDKQGAEADAEQVKRLAARIKQ